MGVERVAGVMEEATAAGETGEGMEVAVTAVEMAGEAMVVEREAEVRVEERVAEMVAETGAAMVGLGGRLRLLSPHKTPGTRLQAWRRLRRSARPSLKTGGLSRIGYTCPPGAIRIHL